MKSCIHRGRCQAVVVDALAEPGQPCAHCARQALCNSGERHNRGGPAYPLFHDSAYATPHCLGSSSKSKWHVSEGIAAVASCGAQGGEACSMGKRARSTAWDARTAGEKGCLAGAAAMESSIGVRIRALGASFLENLAWSLAREASFQGQRRCLRKAGMLAQAFVTRRAVDQASGVVDEACLLVGQASVAGGQASRTLRKLRVLVRKLWLLVRKLLGWCASFGCWCASFGCWCASFSASGQSFGGRCACFSAGGQSFDVGGQSFWDGSR